MVDQLVLDRDLLQAQILRAQGIVTAWDPDNLDQEEVERQLQKINSLESDVRITQVKTFRVVKGSTKYVDDGHEAALETLVSATDVLLVKLLKYKRIVTNTNTPGTSSSFKLERIKLPTFDGSFSEWQSFHDLFKTSVDDNKSLSGAEKMVHLKACLKGEAASIVSAFQTTEANYLEAWKLVKKRYSNKREIIFAHIRKFDEFKPHQESATGLRSVCDSINECSRSLQVLGVPVQHWDLILIYLSLKKIDKESKKEWLLAQGDALPNLKDFIDFMEKRARALAESSSRQSSSSKQYQGKQEGKGKSSTSHASTSSSSCFKCGESHPLYKCGVFANLPLNEKKDIVTKNHLCFNCLFKGHSSSKCKMTFSCRKCGKKHHTLLHNDVLPKVNSSSQPTATSISTAIDLVEVPVISNQQSVSSSHSSPKVQTSHVVLLGTVLVTANNSYGEKQNCRVFMDPGSESHFISERCVDMLHLPRKKTCVDISGIGGSSAGSAKGIVSLRLFSRVRDFSLEINALILPKVSCDLPRVACKSSWPHLEGLELGDPKFFQPGPIDILLGAQVTASLMLPDIVRGAPGSPIAQNTKFGWMLSGSVNVLPHRPIQVFSHHAACSIHHECLQSSLEKFWKLEEAEVEEVNLSLEEKLCEQHFVSTHVRNSDGTYTVELPFKIGAPELGNSKLAAIKRFSKVENRLLKNPKVAEEYVKCMRESLSLDFMELVPVGEEDKEDSQSYYMPHREVIRESSSSTKVRIVFDASAKSSSGFSLNDVLMTGPKLQIDLVPLLIRFRSYPVAMSADIVKFFPQFKVSGKHLDFQRLVWRESPSLPLMEYRMKRVTFGLTCAPYLAIRCLNQLADDKAGEFPLASMVIKEEFLVDNLLSGAQDVDSALHLQQQILHVMHRGKLQLTKWSSNSPEIMEAVPKNHRECLLPHQIKEDDSVKTIGLLWNPGTDTFGVSIVTPDSSIGSKRKVLSSIAKIFDPLGWLSPVTIKPKMLMQELWKLKLEWDSPLPHQYLEQWRSYCEELVLLKLFKIDRCIVGSSSSQEEDLFELHGFSDASQLAYSACVYLRTIAPGGPNVVRLVVAKTKVAPVKLESIPRLELCGALLLSKLMKTVQDSLKLQFQVIHCWTDSTIVLDWLGSEKKLPVFIYNRVHKILQLLPRKNWSYVKGIENPADSASRGISSSALIDHPLWFHGPEWLLNIQVGESAQASTSQVREDSSVLHFIKSCSSFPKMRRIIAYCIRFSRNFKGKKEERIYGPITAEESNHALIRIVLEVQEECFPEEIKRLSRQKQSKKKSKIKCLSPFLEADGVLRVGGRLQQSSLSYNQKHPILLPRKHHLTDVILRHFHHQNLHAAPQLLLACVRDQFWIIRGPDAAKQIVRKCVICHRQNSKLATQFMGQLPLPRVTPSRPFLKCGVDYAGPFQLCLRSGRNPKILKSYVSLFICFSTRAIHLEWVSDLTTDAFIAALTRFISRRGIPSDIYCDGGTNFVGAKNEIQEFMRLTSSSSHQEEMLNFSTDHGIKFHFNPPRAPHHGGLWEAGVKSMKYHLGRIMEERKLSVEEFNTPLCEVEACLNSRPLAAMSSDPNDYNFLTPGHFLIGDSLTALPRPDLTHLNPHRLDRWQAVQQMFQHFWKRWQSDYLSTLQTRPKWMSPQPNMKVGDLVIMRDDQVEWGKNKWKLGRIVKTYPGLDGHVRVCEVKVASGNFYKRPIVKLSPLPIDYSDSTTST